MDLLFFDSSGIVKRYAQEKGTAWVVGLTDPVEGHVLHLAAITQVEVVAAIKRKERERAITPPDSARAIAQFRLHLARQYDVIEITPTTIDRAMLLVETHILKGYDAVQLAAALEANERAIQAGIPGLTFITADDQLLLAARSLHLTVEDPKKYVLPTEF